MFDFVDAGSDLPRPRLSSFRKRILKIAVLVIHPSPVLQSSATISDLALLWRTAVCLLHIQERGTKVCDPNMHNIQPDVDLARAQHEEGV